LLRSLILTVALAACGSDDDQAPTSPPSRCPRLRRTSGAGQWRFDVDLRDGEGDVLPLAQRVSEPFEVIR
jgi:hypothetical protein